MTCARAFGATMHLRGDRLDAELTLPQATDYYSKALTRAVDDLERLYHLPLEVAEQECEKEYQEELWHYNEQQALDAARHMRYEAMATRIRTWIPPTPDHLRLKEFMLQQIKESDSFDCMLDIRKPPEKKTAKQWVQEKIDRAQHQVEYHTEENNKEQARVTTNSKWITDLMEALEREDH
jgi:hypothetical protein